jgi:hypothetical protein
MSLQDSTTSRPSIAMVSTPFPSPCSLNRLGHSTRMISNGSALASVTHLAADRVPSNAVTRPNHCARPVESPISGDGRGVLSPVFRMVLGLQLPVSAGAATQERCSGDKGHVLDGALEQPSHVWPGDPHSDSRGCRLFHFELVGKGRFDRTVSPGRVLLTRRGVSHHPAVRMASPKHT